MASPSSPHPSRITACKPLSGRRPRSHKRCTNGSHAALLSPSATCQSLSLPFATAIGLQSQRDEHHHLLSLALLALAVAFVHLDGFRLGFEAQPNAIELHSGGNITERLNLIDAAVRWCVSPHCWLRWRRLWQRPLPNNTC